MPENKMACLMYVVFSRKPQRGVLLSVHHDIFSENRSKIHDGKAFHTSPHMGHFPQDGENEQNLSFFSFF